MVKLACDMMGSDLGPKDLSKAVVKFVKDHEDVELTCFGKKDELSELEGLNRIKIVDCEEVVPMECGALQLMRLKKSSMVNAIKACKEKEVEGVVSAGSTGGFITGATLFLKNIENVERAALTAPFVTAKKGKQVVILDIGASNENSSSELVGFAKMGSIYAREILNIKSPRVFTLCNGQEEGKGTEEIRGAYKLLKEEKSINFCGNSEAREALDGEHDVIVTPGYPGNIFLKATEGAANLMKNLIKKSFKHSLFSKIGYLFAKNGFKEMNETMDYRKTGGAILLGVNGVAVKGHGNSNAYAFYYAIDVAYRMVKSDIVNKVKEEFSKE